MNILLFGVGKTVTGAVLAKEEVRRAEVCAEQAFVKRMRDKRKASEQSDLEKAILTIAG